MSFLTENVMAGGDWRAFERLGARLLTHRGWHDIQLIGGSGDCGGDILAVDTQGRTWVIQAKSVTGDRLIGPVALKEAINAMSTYGTDAAAVMTNGDFTGTAYMRKDELSELGFDIKLWNGAWLRAIYERLPDYSLSKKEARPYQQEIIDELDRLYDEGCKRALFVMATGLGKTFTVASAVHHFWECGARKILVVCHLQDLALQLEQSFWPQLSKNIPTSCFYEGNPPNISEGVTFGLFQTLQGWVHGMDTDTYDVVIVDEAHHALSRAFSNCLSYLKPKMLIGMTATPWRGDGRLLSSMFGEPIASISIVDGMRLGFLAEVDYRIFCDNIDWSHIQEISDKRLTIRDLNKRLFLPQRDDAIIQNLLDTANKFENPKIAIFSPSIEHSHRFAKMLSLSGMQCRPLSGIDKVQRRANLLGFSSGKFSAVTAVDVMNEGIDVPDVNILVFMRATHSRRIFLQQLGRGLRISGTKKKVVVLDFVSDIRRIAYAIEIDNEARSKDHETLLLHNKLVRFSNQAIGDFVSEWLADVTDDAFDDNQELYFPGLE